MKHTFNLFSDYFSRRDNWVHRLDVRVKMGIAATLFAVVLGSSRCVLPLALFGSAWIGLCLLRIPLRIVFTRFLPPILMAAVLLLLHALTTGQTPAYTFVVGHWTVVAKQEGIALGALQASRIVGAVGVLLLLSSVAPAHELFLGLRWCRFPKIWVEIALLMYRYLFVCLDEASELVDAQRIRLGYGRVRTAISSAGSLIGTVMVRSIEQSARTHEAMVARGYTGDYPFGQMTSMTKRDYGVLGISVCMIIVIYVCVEKVLVLW
ncbi:MAG: cobalt ECF transporter T component CbiQ [bacterium]